MSFKMFIYYCAVCGGWAAFVAWFPALYILGGRAVTSPLLQTILIAGILGVLVAGAVGAVDAFLNAAGAERLARVGVCLGAGVLGSLLGGLIGQSLKYLIPVP